MKIGWIYLANKGEGFFEDIGKSLSSFKSQIGAKQGVLWSFGEIELMVLCLCAEDLAKRSAVFGVDP